MIIDVNNVCVEHAPLSVRQQRIMHRVCPSAVMVIQHVSNASSQDGRLQKLMRFLPILTTGYLEFVTVAYLAKQIFCSSREIIHQSHMTGQLLEIKCSMKEWHLQSAKS